MAIYIKGMDMPTNCTDCCYRPLAGCNPYQDNGLSPSDHRHRTCPLTEVPEPHGRLIDADRVVSSIPSDEAPFCKYLIAKAVASVPTVIEGSK